jgi:hypothetical protein
LLIALGALVAGVALGAVLEVNLWLGFATGALVTVAFVGLAWPRGEAASSSFFRHAESGWGYLRTELARSRRHARNFAVVAIPDDLWSLPTTAPADKTELGATVAATIQSLVRRPDRAWVDGSLLHILLTDCDRNQGLAFLERARAAMPQLFTGERVKLVVFPEDGITSGALLSGLGAGNLRAGEPEQPQEATAR